MTAPAFGAALLLRHLRPAALVRDVVTILVVGSLASFALLFTARTQFDRLLFESGLSYTARSETSDTPAPRASLSVESVDGVQAAAPTASPTGGAALSDFERSRPVPLHAFDPASLGAVRHTYSGVLTSGSVSSDGIVLDEATAAAYGVEVGGSVVLAVVSDAGLRERSVLVTGTSRPYHPPDTVSAGGFVLAPTALVSELLAPGGETSTSFVNYGVPDGRSRSSAVWGVVGEVPQASWLVLAVLVISMGLWLLAMRRVAGELRRLLRRPAATLVALGLAPWAVALVLGAGLVALGAAGAFGAALLARAATVGWTGFYIQRLELALVVALMVLVALATARHAARAPESWLSTGGPQ